MGTNPEPTHEAFRSDRIDPSFLKPGAIELLDALDDLRLPRAIATSSAHHTVEHHLTAHDLVGRFHEIVGHGDYASGKPAPDPFLKAAERLGVEPRLCLAFATVPVVWTASGENKLRLVAG